MKKLLFAICTLVLIVSYSTPAMSYSVGTTNVGGLDRMIWSENLSDSGADTELAWVNRVLIDELHLTTTPYASLIKYDTPENNTLWKATDAYLSGIWAIDFQTTPEYFFVKIGKIPHVSGPDHFLYENKADFAWGVIDLLALGADVEDIYKISHVGEIGNIPQVPEPSTILLLGLGLIGTTLVRRLKK